MSDYSEASYSDEEYNSDSDADYDPALEGVCLDDRAKWCERYYEELTQLYKHFQDNGKETFGEAFFQLGNFGTFQHFCYKYTTSFSER